MSSILNRDVDNIENELLEACNYNANYALRDACERINEMRGELEQAKARIAELESEWEVNHNAHICAYNKSQEQLENALHRIDDIGKKWQEEHIARIRAEENLKLAQAEIAELRNRGWGNDPVIAELRARVAELEGQLLYKNVCLKCGNQKINNQFFYCDVSGGNLTIGSNHD